MQIREVKNEDIKKIALIIEQVSKIHYENRPEIFKKKTLEVIENWLKDTINDENEKILVATDETDTIYGILMYQIKEVKEHFNLKDTKKMWIDEIGIDEEYRKNGIGTQLMQEVEKIAKKSSCSRIELNCWNFNQDAIDFYEKIGMRTQRRIMEKEVNY